jgi:hypothetical protein
MFAVFPAPYVAAGGGGGTTSLAFHDSSTSAVATISVPAGLEAGDLMVLSDFAFNTTNPTLVTPSGFTNWINAGDGANARLGVSYKIAIGDETTLTGMDGNLADNKILAVYRPDVAISTITASTPTSQVTAGDPSSQAITATAGTLPLIAFGFYVSNGAVDPRTFSPAATGSINNGTAHYLLYQLQNAALADVSIDMDDEGSTNILAGGYLWAA